MKPTEYFEQFCSRYRPYKGGSWCYEDGCIYRGLQQLSKALRVSAETLYVKAGILDPDDHPATTVETAVLSDVAITERQKRVLIDVYQSFVKENEKDGVAEPAPEAAESASEAAESTSKQKKKTKQGA